MPLTASPIADSARAGDAPEGLPIESGRGGSTWKTAVRLARFSAAVDPRAFVLTVATALAGSLAEGAGLVLLLPLLAVAGMNFSGSSTAGWLVVASQRLLVGAGVPRACGCRWCWESFWRPARCVRCCAGRSRCWCTPRRPGCSWR